MDNCGNSIEYTKSDQTFLKNYNVKKILNILRKYDSLSRIELATISSLDKKTITNIVNELLEKNQVKVAEKISDGNGRPKEMITLNGEYCKCIGVDLGGTHISGVVIDFTGKVICSNNIDLNNDMEPDTLIKLCYYIVDKLLAKTGLNRSDLTGIGVSIPGYVDKETGVSLFLENLPKWHQVALKRIFEEHYDVNICVDDCSRLMALSELWYGEGGDCDDFLVFDLGLGIGCGIVINRKIFAGSSGKAGEIGHTIVKVDGPICTCGRHGCIESLASGWAISHQAKTALDNGEKTLLSEIVLNGLHEPTIREIVLAAELGDEYCCNLLSDAGQYIGIGIANAISIFNPAKVIIGGRLVKDNSILLKKIKETAQAQIVPIIFEETQLIESKLGLYASAIGAATLCLEKYY